MNFNGDLQQLESGIHALSTLLNTNLEDTITLMPLSKDHDYCLEITRGDTCTIAYKEKHHFFRALGLYLQYVYEEQGTFSYREQVTIPTCGAMIDCSRNSVYKVSKIKELLIKLSVMGHSTCMLYTEDTYEVEGYPYFGYLRGAYSKSELQALDTFAFDLGIELVPCIQTLAHLKQTLNWNYAQNFKDTADVLLVGCDEAYAFIDAMLKSIKDTFRTNRIHIGMDEAFDLGHGKSLQVNGYKHHNELMIMHLARVNELLSKYNFEAMMWDDMFLRSTDPHGNHYDVDTPVDPIVAASVPSNISLVYWDYYHAEEEFYTKSFIKRKAFNNPVIFAGGVWKWTGYAPNYGKTFVTTNAALTSCKKQGIKEVLATMWGDDGDETPIDSTLLGLMLFAEHSYLDTVDDEWLNRRCEFLTGHQMQDFIGLGDLDILLDIPTPNLPCYNPSKYFLYQDLLLGAFDFYVKDEDLYSHYTELAERYDDIAENSVHYNDLFKMYADLSRVLAIKTNIGCYIQEAYKTRDLSALTTMCEEVIPTLISEIKSFQESLRNIWFTDCKGHGFEILDIRLGGVISRCETTRYRLGAYISNPDYIIEELEEEKKPFHMRYINHDNLPVYNQYASIASQNIFSHNV